MSGKVARPSIPWFGTRKLAEQLQAEVDLLRQDRDRLAALNERFGGLSMFEIEECKSKALADAAAQRELLERGVCVNPARSAANERDSRLSARTISPKYDA